MSSDDLMHPDHEASSSVTRAASRERCAPLRSFMLIGMPLILAACSSPRYQEVSLRVTDGQSGSPVAGAEVSIRPLKFYLPMGNAPSPTPGDFQSARGVTDAGGLITLRAADNAPSELMVTHPEFSPWRGLIEPWEDSRELLQWRLEPAAIGLEPGVALDIEVAPR